MSGSNTRPASLRNWRVAGLFAVGLLTLGLVYLCTSALCRSGGDGDSTNTPGAEPTVDGEKLFATWPANVKPDAVIVLTGQTFGFLQPCGCTRPQKGGLERRANFINQMRAKGWQVVGF